MMPRLWPGFLIGKQTGVFKCPKSLLSYRVFFTYGAQRMPSCLYYSRGDNMDKDRQEQQNRKKSEELFNSITEKRKPENQNQTHNSRREGMGPNTIRKPRSAPERVLFSCTQNMSLMTREGQKYWLMPAAWFYFGSKNFRKYGNNRNSPLPRE